MGCIGVKNKNGRVNDWCDAEDGEIKCHPVRRVGISAEEPELGVHPLRTEIQRIAADTALQPSRWKQSLKLCGCHKHKLGAEDCVEG
jgi:hypothetical protein